MLSDHVLRRVAVPLDVLVRRYDEVDGPSPAGQPQVDLSAHRPVVVAFFTTRTSRSLLARISPRAAEPKDDALRADRLDDGPGHVR